MSRYGVVKSDLIADGQTLVGAKGRFGRDIKVYDDGWGQLFIHRDSMGISGIVRARTWEEAYGICEDMFFPEADLTDEEMEKEYSTIYKSGRELWLHEHNNDWEAWQALTDAERNEIYRPPGKNVPFDSANGGYIEHPCWQESYGFRPNGPRELNEKNPGIYSKDSNGDYLDVLDKRLLDELEITLEIKGEPYEDN